MLYKVTRGGNRFHVADPAKGKVAYLREKFENRWLSTADNDDERKGITMFFQPTEEFYSRHEVDDIPESSILEYIISGIRP